MNRQTDQRPSAIKTGRVFSCSMLLLLLLLLNLRLPTTNLYNLRSLLEVPPQDGSTNTIPLLHQIAPTLFSLDPTTHQIQFASSVQHLVVDVGARNSEYLAALEQSRDPTVGLILVDPLPDSVVPLQIRAHQYNLQPVVVSEQQNKSSTTITTDPPLMVGERVYVIRGAMGETESTTDFHASHYPACGSLLPTGTQNTFGCWHTSHQVRVNVFTLKDLLELIPDDLESLHLKVDAEGADHLVLRGAGSALTRFSTIVMECMPSTSNDTNDKVRPVRDGQCQNNEVIDWMCHHHEICDATVIPQGGLSNIVFRNARRLVVPQLLTKLPWIMSFGKFYQDSWEMQQPQQQQQQQPL